MSDKQKLVFLQSAPLTANRGIRHGFFTRRGGVSRGLYDSLNCGPGSSDAPDSVQENRRRVAATFDLQQDKLFGLYQVHGRDVVTLTETANYQERPKADGAVTNVPGLGLSILTADCAPILLADPEAGVIGACHAGWKGALSGITDATVAAMVGLGARPASIIAAIGPLIAQNSYEVGPEFPAPFLAQSAKNQVFFGTASRAGHFLFDLAGYVKARLLAQGLRGVEAMERDTRREDADFFSYRRATLAKEPDYGRQISVIALKAP